MNLRLWQAIVFVISINLVFIMPVILSGDHFHLTLMPTQDAHRADYFIPANEFSDSGSIARDMCIYEQADRPFARIQAGAAVYGVIQKIIGNPVYSHLIGNVLLSMIIFFLVNCFIKTEFRNDLAILFVSLMFLPLYPDTFRHYFNAFSGFIATGDMVGPLASVGFPITIAITRTVLYAHFFLFLWVFFNKKINPRNKLIALILLLGVAIYIHIYSALLLFITLGFLGAIDFIKKNKNWKEKAIILFGGGLLSLPFVIRAYIITGIYDKVEMAFRYGIYYMPSFYLPSLAYILFFVVSFFIILKSRRSEGFKRFFMVMVLSVFVSGNVHIITRNLPQPDNIVHFAYVFFLPLIACILAEDFLKREIIKKVSLISLLIFSLFYLSCSVFISDKSYLGKDFSEVIDFIKENHDSGDVFLMDMSLQKDILTWTKINLYYCDVFFNNIGFEEMGKRVIQGSLIMQKDEFYINETMDTFIHDIATEKTGISKVFDEALVSFPEQDFSGVKAKISKIKNSKKEFSRPTYKLDYILLRKGIDTIDPRVDTDKVFENDGYIIVKILEN